VLVIRIGVGAQTETLPEWRADGELLVSTLREMGLAVADLEVVEDAGEPGVATGEWFTIFLGSGLSPARLTDLTNDVYDAAKRSATRRRHRANSVHDSGQPIPVGFVIYGPDDQEFRRWSTLDEGVVDGRWPAPTGLSWWRKAMRKLTRRY
jgi:hypothetical protein